MRLRVDHRTGAVILTFPHRMPPRKALAWAQTQSGWVEQQLANVPPAQPLRPGATVPLYGEPHLVDWAEGRPRTVRIEPGRLVLGGPEFGVEARILRWLRAEALRVMSEETKEFAAIAGVGIVRVGVGDPLSRWGSCSSSGAIRYSWRLILAPPFVRRATVAHEVAHRVHMNHGPDFRRLVKELVGRDEARSRLWLRRNGAALHRIGAQ